jgi:hypothetical protein
MILPELGHGAKKSERRRSSGPTPAKSFVKHLHQNGLCFNEKIKSRK